MRTKNSEEILTVPEAAKLLKISNATAYTWTHIEGFPKVKVGNTIRIPRSLLLDWMNEQAKGGACPPRKEKRNG